MPFAGRLAGVEAYAARKQAVMIELRNPIQLRSRRRALVGRQCPATRYCEGGGSRRSPRAGHAFKGVFREPRRSRYLFGEWGVGSARCNEPAYLPWNEEIVHGGSENLLNRSQPSPSQSRRRSRVTEKSYEPMVPVKVGNPRAPATGGQGTHWRDGGNRWTV